MTEFEALGTSGAEFSGLETFVKPGGCEYVQFSGNELTARCPVTNQPDFYEFVIEYSPLHECVETKSLKLYLETWRDKPVFAEALAAQIAKDVSGAVKIPVTATLIQQIRGGIVTTVKGMSHA